MSLLGQKTLIVLGLFINIFIIFNPVCPWIRSFSNLLSILCPQLIIVAFNN